MNCITGCFTDTSTRCSEGVSDYIGHTWTCLTATAESAGRGLQAGRNAAVASAKHTGGYVQRNWVRLTAITLAWAVIILGTGILYGFQSGSLISGLQFTAKPLAIGFAAGFGFGILTGILTKLKFDPANKRDNTIAEVILNQWIGHLGLTTQLFIMTISISIALAAIPALPIPMGGVFGVMVGNYLSTKFALNADLGDPSGDSKDVKVFKATTQTFKAIVDALEALNSKSANCDEKIAKARKLADHLATFLEILSDKDKALAAILHTAEEIVQALEAVKNNPGKSEQKIADARGKLADLHSKVQALEAKEKNGG